MFDNEHVLPRSRNSCSVSQWRRHCRVVQVRGRFIKHVETPRPDPSRSETPIGFVAFTGRIATRTHGRWSDNPARRHERISAGRLISFKNTAQRSPCSFAGQGAFSALQNAPENARYSSRRGDREISMPADFDRQGFGLEPLPSQVSHGLIGNYIFARAASRAPMCSRSRGNAFQIGETPFKRLLRFNVRRHVLVAEVAIRSLGAVETSAVTPSALFNSWKACWLKTRLMVG